MKVSKTIAFVDAGEDPIKIEANQALSRGMEDNFKLYCQILIAQVAMAGIDLRNYQAEKKIYYIEL